MRRGSRYTRRSRNRNRSKAHADSRVGNAHCGRLAKAKRALGGGGVCLWGTWYKGSPSSVFVDSILSPCFLAAVERKPRTLWACQSVAFWISASVAPLARSISARIFAPLLSARGVLALAASRLADF